jgi:hypothetical protein
MIQAISTSETSASFYKITLQRPRIKSYRRRENMKSDRMNINDHTPQHDRYREGKIIKETVQVPYEDAQGHFQTERVRISFSHAQGSIPYNLT